MKSDADRWTEDRVFALLPKVFTPPAWVLLPQVRNGTGYAKSTVRTADALAASVWPSRGLYFVGCEIKVTTSDWRKELAKPEKSVEIQKYCRHWYVAAPKGVVPDGTLPPTWGLIECTAQTAKIVVPAPTLEPSPVDVLFVCSALRAASQAMVPRGSSEDIAAQVSQARQDGYKKGRELAEHRAKEDNGSAVQAIQEFRKTSGVDIRNTWYAGQVGEAVRLILDSGVEGVETELKRQRSTLLRLAAKNREACRALKKEREDEKAKP